MSADPRMGNSWRERISHFNKRRLGLATGWPSRAPTGPKSGLLRPSRPRRSWVRSGPHRLARQDYLSVLGTACRRVRVAHEALQRGVVARIVTGPHDATRQDPHLPMRYDTGRPSSVIRFRISQPRTTSLPCPDGLRARRPSPIMDVSRKHVCSTRP